ncbi:MAG: hypothetical protein GY855_16770 [candidate division Zixibacteria bacterium]|nr:hypothetical protein [candidate division Zixibacteria bacterium]
MLGLVVLFVVFNTTPVTAQDRPVQLSLFSPVQIFPEDESITGIRLSLIYGKNASVTGFDWGLVSHTTTGISKGVQFGFVGLVDSNFVGWQGTSVNVVKGNFEGLQWGFVNYANYASGLQLGFVNYTGSMKGLQIGLVNIIRQGGTFPVFPIVNWSF